MGHYCSYLLPKQAGGNYPNSCFQNLANNRTPRAVQYVAQSRPVSPSPRKAKILKLNRRRYLANTSMCSPSRRRDLSIVYDVVRTPRRNVAETFSGSRNVIKCRLTPLLHCLTLRTLAFGWRGSRSVSLGHYLHRLNPLLIVLILSPPSISIPVQ